MTWLQYTVGGFLLVVALALAVDALRHLAIAREHRRESKKMEEIIERLEKEKRKEERGKDT